MAPRPHISPVQNQYFKASQVLQYTMTVESNRAWSQASIPESATPAIRHVPSGHQEHQVTCDSHYCWWQNQT